MDSNNTSSSSGQGGDSYTTVECTHPALWCCSSTNNFIKFLSLFCRCFQVCVDVETPETVSPIDISSPPQEEEETSL